MTEIVSITTAKTHLSRLLAAVEDGHDFVITRAGRPVARLVPIRAHSTRRRLGGLRGRIWMADDWDSAEVNAGIQSLFDR